MENINNKDYNFINLNKLHFMVSGYSFDIKDISKSINIIKDKLFDNISDIFIFNKSIFKIEREFYKLKKKKNDGIIEYVGNSKINKINKIKYINNNEGQFNYNSFSNDYFNIRNQFNIYDIKEVLKYIDYIKDLDNYNIGIPEEDNDDVYFKYYYNRNSDNIYYSELNFYIYGYSIDYNYDKYIKNILEILNFMVDTLDIKHVYLDIENGDNEGFLRSDLFEFGKNENVSNDSVEKITNIGYINILPNRVFKHIKKNILNNTNYIIKQTSFDSVLIKFNKSILDFTMKDRNILIKDFLNILEPRYTILNLSDIRPQWEHLSLYNCEYKFIKPLGSYYFSEQYILKNISKTIKIEQFCPYQILVNFNKFNYKDNSIFLKYKTEIQFIN